MTKSNSELRRIDKKLAKAIDEQKIKIREITNIEKISDQQASESLFQKFQRLEFTKKNKDRVKF